MEQVAIQPWVYRNIGQSKAHIQQHSTLSDVKEGDKGADVWCCNTNPPFSSSTPKYRIWIFLNFFNFSSWMFGLFRMICFQWYKNCLCVDNRPKLRKKNNADKTIAVYMWTGPQSGLDSLWFYSYPSIHLRKRVLNSRSPVGCLSITGPKQRDRQTHSHPHPQPQRRREHAHSTHTKRKPTKTNR